MKGFTLKGQAESTAFVPRLSGREPPPSPNPSSPHPDASPLLRSSLQTAPPALLVFSKPPPPPSPSTPYQQYQTLLSYSAPSPYRFLSRRFPEVSLPASGHCDGLLRFFCSCFSRQRYLLQPEFPPASSHPLIFFLLFELQILNLQKML